MFVIDSSSLVNAWDNYPVDVSIVSYSMILKKVIGVEEDQYGPKGVDENDIFVIASAHCKDMILISDEGVQFTVPKNLANCKIPMVCQLAEENIECIKLIDFINRSSLSI